MPESIGEISKQAQAGRQDRRTRRDATAKVERRSGIAASLAVLATMAGIIIADRINNSPECEGTQNVPVLSGDTLDGLMYDNIEVPDGSRVDLRAVDTDVIRDGAEVSTSMLRPGDTIVMPDSCQ